MSLKQAEAALDAAREILFAHDRATRAAVAGGDMNEGLKLNAARADVERKVQIAFDAVEAAKAGQDVADAAPEAVHADDSHTRAAFARAAKAADALAAHYEKERALADDFTRAVEDASAEFGTNPRLRGDVRVRLLARPLVMTERARLGLPGGDADLVSNGVDHIRQLPTVGNILRAVFKQAWT